MGKKNRFFQDRQFTKDCTQLFRNSGESNHKSLNELKCKIPGLQIQVAEILLSEKNQKIYDDLILHNP